MPNEETESTSTEVTPEEKQPDLSAIVNAAVSSHLKRELKKFDISKMVQEAIAPLQAKIESQQPQPEPKNGKGKEDPEMAALRQRLEDMEKRANQANERAQDLERKRKDDLTYNDVRKALSDRSVKPEAVGFLADWLFKASGKIEYDDDGTPLFKVRKAPAQGLAEEDVLVPLADGVDMFLKSKEAAIFLPPPAQSGGIGKTGAATRKGSKSNAGGPPTWEHPARTPEERAQRAAAMADWVRSQTEK